MNQLDKILKFQVILSYGGLNICRKAIKVTKCDLAETRTPYTYFLGQGSRECVEIFPQNTLVPKK